MTHLQRGLELFSNQHFYAVLEHCQKALVETPTDHHEAAELYDLMGLAYIQIDERDKAVQSFTKALDFDVPISDKAKYNMHLALAHSWSGGFDIAHRLMIRILETEHELNIVTRAKAYVNLAFIDSLNEFYREGLQHTEKSLELFEEAGVTQNRKAVLSNLGYFNIQLSRYDTAEWYLKEAVQIEGEPQIAPIMELSRLYFLKGDIDKSVYYAQQTLDNLWSSLMNYQRTDIAQTCRLLANIAYGTGERSLAIRLIEKAKILFGQLEMWSQWIEAQDTCESWESEEEFVVYHTPKASQIKLLNDFITLLDAIHIQERLSPTISAILDARALYIQKLCEQLGITDDKLQDLILASRLMDYGLSAIEFDVIENPHRSPAAWEQYIQHPQLSISMLSFTSVPKSVLELIEDHHENYDGSGYPTGKSGSALSLHSQILSVCDYYATVVCTGEMSHTSALREITAERGKKFCPDVVDAFCKLFDLVEAV